MFYARVGGESVWSQNAKKSQNQIRDFQNLGSRILDVGLAVVAVFVDLVTWGGFINKKIDGCSV